MYIYGCRVEVRLVFDVAVGWGEAVHDEEPHRFCTETFWPISPLMTTDRIQMRSRAADCVPQHTDEWSGTPDSWNISSGVSDYRFSAERSVWPTNKRASSLTQHLQHLTHNDADSLNILPSSRKIYCSRRGDIKSGWNHRSVIKKTPAFTSPLWHSSDQISFRFVLLWRLPWGICLALRQCWWRVGSHKRIKPIHPSQPFPHVAATVTESEVGDKTGICVL